MLSDVRVICTQPIFTHNYNVFQPFSVRTMAKRRERIKNIIESNTIDAPHYFVLHICTCNKAPGAGAHNLWSNAQVIATFSNNRNSLFEWECMRISYAVFYSSSSCAVSVRLYIAHVLCTSMGLLSNNSNVNNQHFKHKFQWAC